MSTEQGHNRNKIKMIRVCLYGVLCALCLVLGYIESLINLSFIAPGVKIGISNAVALILAAKGDIKGAFAVNITRILLSALLFGSPFSLLFSLTGGIASLTVISLLIKLKSVSVIGCSTLAGAVHNIFQLIVAALVLGSGVLWYLPLLIAAGAGTGILVGIFSSVILKKIETNQFF